MITKEKDTQGRELKFLDNEQNMEFKHKISITIYFKIYLETSHKKSQKVDPLIIDFFNDSNMVKLQIKDKFLNEEHKITNMFEAINFHSKLTQIVLSNCGLSDDSLDLLLYRLGLQKNQVWHLDLS